MARRTITSPGSLLLDSEGLAKLATGNERARSYFETARERQAQVIVSAITCVEVLRGNTRDAGVHRVLGRVATLPVTPELAKAAGKLLGTTGLEGHQHAIDAVVAATALSLPRPVVLLTSDPDDLNRLTEEPEKPKEQRVAVVGV